MKIWKCGRIGSNLIKKNIQKYIFDVKFPVESNRPDRIFQKSMENLENSEKPGKA